jgi:hypothetical protein
MKRYSLARWLRLSDLRFASASDRSIRDDAHGVVGQLIPDAAGDDFCYSIVLRHEISSGGARRHTMFAISGEAASFPVSIRIGIRISLVPLPGSESKDEKLPAARGGPFVTPRKGARHRCARLIQSSAHLKDGKRRPARGRRSYRALIRNAETVVSSCPDCSFSDSAAAAACSTSAAFCCVT